MHLPFTFATGEALLYQTGYPLHGFPDAFQGRAKGSKSKKGKVDKSCADDLDPKSLLGALMSQDESVYVCQPDSEPRTSYSSSSSLFSQLQGEADSCSWPVVSNGEITTRCNGKASGYDPLLSTLDSLSLDGEEETCSNSELFTALENLGLNAEDLELLLLDERMIQVELDPNHIPTLSDLLTNNEILSYIHDSLDGDGQGTGGGFGPSGPPQDSAHPPPPPIVQLSQQMQQHMSAGELGRSQSTSIVSPGVANGHWVENLHHLNHQHTLLKASQVNGQHRHLWPVLQQDQHLPANQQGALLPGYQNQPGLATAGSYIPNGHTVFPEVSHTHYSVSNTAQCQQVQLPPTQSPALDLEQLLALSPSLEACNMFSSSTEEAHSKVRARVSSVWSGTQISVSKGSPPCTALSHCHGNGFCSESAHRGPGLAWSSV